MNSLRGRLLLAAGVVLCAFVVLTGLALERAFFQSAQQAERDKLQGLVYALLGATDVDQEGEVRVSEAELPDERLLRPGSGLYLAVRDVGGRTVWKSPSMLAEIPLRASLSIGEWRYERVAQEASGALFVLAFGVSWSGEGGEAKRYTFVALEDTAEFTRQLNVFERTLFLWLMVAAVLLLLGLLLVLRWGLAPLKRLASEIGAIEEGAREQLEGVYPAELLPLTSGLNTLLRHERQRQTRYRNALDDLAHSLKTPLAVLRGFCEHKALSGERLERLGEQVARMDQIVGYQLQKAATAGARGLTRPIELRRIVGKIVNAVGKVYWEKNIDFSLNIPASMPLRADEGDLMEVVGSLLDNASKWCRSRVNVAVRAHDGRIRMDIEDDGPGFPPAQARMLLQRGTRADTRVEGQGIGLSVVAEITQAYGGELNLDRSSMGGARVTITLPDSL